VYVAGLISFSNSFYELVSWHITTVILRICLIVEHGITRPKQHHNSCSCTYNLYKMFHMTFYILKRFQCSMEFLLETACLQNRARRYSNNKEEVVKREGRIGMKNKEKKNGRKEK